MTAQLITIGDNVVDCYVDLGWMYPGGNMVNVAVHAARLGQPATYIGVLGDDASGELVLRSLKDEGVDTTALRVMPGDNARATVQIVDGNRVFGSGSVGVSRFVPTEQDLAALAAADLVHTGDCSMLEDQLASIRRSAQRLSFDFSERPWDYVRSLAPLVDIAICSAPDHDQQTADDLARQVQAHGPRTVVITQGAAGASLLDRDLGDDLIHAPAGPGEVVDTLGAGDAFIARLLTGMLRNQPAPRFLAAATRYATACCAEVGAFGHRAALPQLTTP